MITNTTTDICYLILPEGVSKGLSLELQQLSQRFKVATVLVDQVHWNDDLTPWPSPGVFKKAKPFGGKAHEFLERLTHEIIPTTEASLGINPARRTLLGVSLSGLFALWTGFNTDTFSNIISLSGSLWYDGFTDWMKNQPFSSKVENVCLLLGNREKQSKEKRMATVEEQTVAAAHILKEKCHGNVTFELVEGTHFSPIMPRIERAWNIVFH